MILNNRIKLLFLLCVLCINNGAEANLGDWMQDTGVRSMAYVSQFARSGIRHIWSVDPKFKLVFAAGVGCLLFKAGYVQQLIKDAPNKREKKKIKKEYPISSQDMNGLGAVIYTATVGTGLDHYQSALIAENIAKNMAQSNTSSGFLIFNDSPSFLPDEKIRIEAGLKQMSLNPSKFILVKEAGGNGAARGTSEGGIITLGEDVCKDPEQLNVVLGHEAGI